MQDRVQPQGGAPFRWVGAGLAGGAVLVLALSLVYVWRSDLAYLAASWLPDDAYYYLQPAWLTRSHPGYTFDGHHTTAGFQPLWMLLLSGLAQLTPDKEALLRGTLTLGVVLHVAVGALLWAWLRRSGHEWRGVVAAALWWVNPSLLHLEASGMEAPLYALLLVGVLGFSLHRLARGAWPAVLVHGVLCGLLILCRTEAVLLVAALLVHGAWRDTGGLRRRLGRCALVLAGIVLTVGPWTAYSAVRLKAWVPTSGEVKAVGAPARVARTAAAALPFLPRDWFRGAVPPAERPLFDAERLPMPTPAFAWRVGIAEPVRWALGSWLPGSLVSGGERSLRDGLLLPLLAVYLALGGWSLVRRRRAAAAPGLWLLGGWALLDATIQCWVLMPYAEQQFWRRVPEALFLVALVAHGVPLVLESVRARPWAKYSLAGYAILVLAASLFAYGSILSPRRAGGDQDENRAAWEAAQWLGAHVPAGERVGSWHAGLLGYVADGPVVVNLDGLANDRAYLTEVVRGEQLLRLGRSEENPTLGYLEREQIRWVADVEHPSRLGHEAFQQVLPPGRYEVVFESQERVRWDRDVPTHVVAVVRLRDAPAGPPPAEPDPAETIDPPAGR